MWHGHSRANGRAARRAGGRRAPVRPLCARAVLRNPLRLLRFQHLHTGRAGRGQSRRVAGGAAHGTGTGRRAAAAPTGEHRVRRGRDALAAGGRAAGAAAGHGARALRAGARRGDHHRGQPRVDVAGVLRRHRGGRLHPGVAGYAVGGAAGAGCAGPHSHAEPVGGRRPRGAGRRVRARQPRSHLRDAGGVRRGPAVVARHRDRKRCGPRVRLCAGGRGRHGAGPEGAPR